MKPRLPPVPAAAWTALLALLAAWLLTWTSSGLAATPDTDDDLAGRSLALQRAHQAVLGDCQKCRGPLPIQILLELVHMKNEKLLLRHRVLITVQAINNDCANVFFLHTRPDPVREFAGRYFGCVHLLDD